MQKSVMITDLDAEGRGVGRLEGGVVFCAGAYPGDKISLRVIKQHKAWAEAEMCDLLSPSPDRIKALCPHAARCGGCTLQAYAYDAQLRWKRRLVEETLRRIGGIDDCPVLPTIGMETPFAYRNKSAFPFAQIDGKPVPGLYERGSHRLCAVDSCPIQHPAADAALHAVRDWAAAHSLSAYDERSTCGLLRHLVIRTGFATGQVMVVLVMNGETLPHTGRLISALKSALEAMPGFALRSVWLNENTKKTNVILGEKGNLLYGAKTITERLGALTYEISPLSFFQVNPVQAERMYALLRDWCAPSPERSALDLYCGIGGIALSLAPHLREVCGVESVSQAVHDAEENARRNGLSEKARFVCATAEDWLPAFMEQGRGADIAVIDPPRKGCSPALLQALRSRGPDRLVYVSCNPSTLARDLALLKDSYFPEQIQPLDMFPHTAHVESVGLLSKIQN